MIKRSSLSNQLSESCGWWNRNSERMGEWTYEGGRKRKRVVTDGKRTRYQSVTVWLYRADDFFINLGGTAGIYKSCPIVDYYVIRLFLFGKIEYLVRENS